VAAVGRGQSVPLDLSNHPLSPLYSPPIPCYGAYVNSARNELQQAPGVALSTRITNLATEFRNLKAHLATLKDGGDEWDTVPEPIHDRMGAITRDLIAEGAASERELADEAAVLLDWLDIANQSGAKTKSTARRCYPHQPNLLSAQVFAPMGKARKFVPVNEPVETLRPMLAISE
jgi:hypothetical protein